MDILGTPPAEVECDPALVRKLLLEQHPDLADLPVEPFDTGWDNVMFRLGSGYLVRLPRRVFAARPIENEQRWLPVLAKQLSIPVPAPIRNGIPCGRYPWSWSILPWFDGCAADLAPPNANQATPLAVFLRELHTQAHPDAPSNPARGPIRKSAVEGRERIRRLLARSLIQESVSGYLEAALEAPVAIGKKWIHGDLHARNVLVVDGCISAIVDWGDMTGGDPATDLASFWMLLPDKHAREEAWAVYGTDEATRLRARGWAVLFGLVLLETGLIDNPRHAVMGRLTLQRVTEET